MTKAQREPRKFKRWLRTRLLPRCSKLCAFVGLVILGLWIVGRVLTDQYQWSQYLWWVPPIWMIGLAWICLGMSAFLAIFSRRLGGLLLRPVLLLACVGCTGYLMIGVWHIHRALLPSERADDAIRIAHWNHAAKKIDEQAWAQSVFDQQIDIVLLSNPHWGDDRQAILDALSPFAPRESERWVNYSYRVHGDPAHFSIVSDAMIASRYPMIRSGRVSFGSSERQQVLDHSSSNLGWIMFIEFNLAERSDTEPSQPAPEPIPFVIWLVDLPSDPSNPRQQSMQEARQAIDSWNGAGWKMGRHVWEQTTQERASFPEPDLIIGDFNTPRGSDSLDRLSPGMADAYEAVGYGRARSWTPRLSNRYIRQPIKLANWHIDLSLVGEGWRSTRYRVVDIRDWASTAHNMQIVDLTRQSTKLIYEEDR